MRLGRVIGSVVCQQKEPSLAGTKLLLVVAVDARGAQYGEPFVACDSVQAGPGDLVLWEGGREAALAFPNWFTPADSTIMAIVDAVDAEAEA
jgi:ethanolamine utilization protein EutN